LPACLNEGQGPFDLLPLFTNVVEGVFSEVRGLIDRPRRDHVAEEAHYLNIAVLLPVVAGATIALQTVLNSLGMRLLGSGASSASRDW
jgi:hypothetical protein